METEKIFLINLQLNSYHNFTTKEDFQNLIKYMYSPSIAYLLVVLYVYPEILHGSILYHREDVHSWTVYVARVHN